ncbi:MAG: acetolactate synthase small subunit [bacterium]|jgi:acetolactate synthase-1/3 small subunit
MKHIINCLVENQPGVLARIVGLISGRGYNIDTLNVGPTADPTVSKMTIVVPGDAKIIDQVTKQLSKQVDVIDVVELTDRRHLERELVLVRVGVADNAQRAEVLDLASTFNATVIDIQKDSISLQVASNQGAVAEFLKLLQPHKIFDLSRSGVIAVGRECV